MAESEEAIANRNKPTPDKGVRPWAQKATRDQAISMIVAGAGTREIARACGVSASTASAWRKLPEVEQAMADAAVAVRRKVQGKLAAAVDDAWRSMLKGVREDPKLALSFLDKVGALSFCDHASFNSSKNTGNSSTSGVQIVINTHSDDHEPEAKVIDCANEELDD